MNLDQILAAIAENHNDPDIHHLVDQMAAGNYHVRKQLADMVCVQPAKQVPIGMIYEISKWGVTDDLSLCPEIQKLTTP